MNTQQLDQLHHKVEELMAETGTPGVAIGLLHGEQEHLAGFGVTNVNHPLTVDGDTLFQIGSTSKTFTATAAMQLAEQGKLDLNTPIRTYLPDFQMQDGEVMARATLRHCFTHTGGWLGDFFDDTGNGDDALAIYVQRMADLPQDAPLGALWSYNNAGFGLAGRVIEVVAGKPFEQVIQEQIFAPLGMECSFYFANDVMIHRFAVGHNVEITSPPTKPVVATPWNLARSAHAAGGITSSARDQLRYARAHLGMNNHSTQSLLSDSARIAMQQELVAAGSMADSVGISWLLAKQGGVKTVAHGGATNGQLSAFLMVPERNFAVTVLTNANRGRELHSRLVPWVLEQFLDLRDPPTTFLTRTPEQLAEFCGHYEARMSHIDVSHDRDGLLIKMTPQGGFPYKESPPPPAPPPAHIQFFGNDRLMVMDGPSKGGKMEIVRDAKGKVAWLRAGGRVHRRQ